jgi:16S rRNA (guanine527-N7)-methyltransferase
MILAEPRGQRVEFLKRVCESLRLRDIEVHAGKVGPKYTRPVSGVITRAVASIPDTLERVANCLQPGGRMLFMKGPECDNEIADARASHGDTFRLLADHAYKIPRTPHQRRLLVYERLTAPSCSIGEAIRSQPAKAVTSPANPTFKLLFDLLNARGIRKHGQALMMGSRPVREVLAQFPDRVLGWITDTGGEAPPLRPGAEPIEWIRLADPLFRDLDMFGTHAPLLLVRVHEFPDWSDQAPWPEGCTLFLPFQDPENVGAVIRTAAAFGVARVVLLREAAHPFHPKAVRAAGTTLLQVRLERGPSINDLIVRGAPLIALDTCGPVLASQPFPFSFGLVVGIEGPGLPPRLREGLRRRIPIAPEVESLNAAAATAVALYEWRRANSL